MSTEDTKTESTWSARNVRPVIAVYVLGVFCGFFALAHFVFHSPEAVKALFMAAVAGVASLVPTILSKVEYRLTETGVAKRTLSGKRTREFKDIFRWDELSHVVSTRSGFKYYKKITGSNPIARFLKLHVSGNCSGELHVERRDLHSIRTLLRQRGVRISGSPNSLDSSTLPGNER